MKTDGKRKFQVNEYEDAMELHLIEGRSVEKEYRVNEEIRTFP